MHPGSIQFPVKAEMIFSCINGCVSSFLWRRIIESICKLILKYYQPFSLAMYLYAGHISNMHDYSCNTCLFKCLAPGVHSTQPNGTWPRSSPFGRRHLHLDFLERIVLQRGSYSFKFVSEGHHSAYWWPGAFRSQAISRQSDEQVHIT